MVRRKRVQPETEEKGKFTLLGNFVKIQNKTEEKKVDPLVVLESKKVPVMSLCELFGGNTLPKENPKPKIGTDEKNAEKEEIKKEEENIKEELKNDECKKEERKKEELKNEVEKEESLKK